MLQIQRATGNFLFVEAREAIGFDVVLEQYPAVLAGVTVYVGPFLRSQSLVDIVFTTPPAPMRRFCSAIRSMTWTAA